MKKFLPILISLTASLILSACRHVNQQEIAQLKKRYSQAEINYFYEVALFDNINPKDGGVLKRWNTDLYISITGDSLRGDRQIFNKVISEINSLGLPVKLYETKDPSKANVVIKTGERKNLKDIQKETLARKYTATGILGLTELNRSSGDITSATISIVNEDPGTPAWRSRRDYTIFHEMVHLLGPAGHSFTYSDVALCPYYGQFNGRLNHFDKQALKILYEPALPTSLKNSEFENYFDDVLYHTHSKTKLLKLIEATKTNKQVLDSILQFGFSQSLDKSDNQTVKFSFPATVVIAGTYPPNFLKIIKGAIEELNSLGEVNLIFDQGKHGPFEQGIRYTFKRDPTINRATRSSVSVTTDWGLRFPRHTKSEILVKYKEQNNDSVGLAIANNLFRSLCVQDKDDLFTLNEHGLHLTPESKELLKFYYNPSFSSGLSKTDFKQVLDRIAQK